MQELELDCSSDYLNAGNSGQIKPFSAPTANMSELKLFSDNLSPVCRPVMLLLAANEIDYEYIYINLVEGTS